jgi:hypothetical protein
MSVHATDAAPMETDNTFTSSCCYCKLMNRPLQQSYSHVRLAVRFVACYFSESVLEFGRRSASNSSALQFMLVSLKYLYFQQLQHLLSLARLSPT